MQKKWDVDESIIQRCQDANRWFGSHYELALAYGRKGLDLQTRLSLLHMVWNSSSLLGVVNHPREFGQAWESVDSSLVSEPYHQFYGCVRLDNGQVVGCRSSFLVIGDEIWFILFIPLSMLSLAYPVNYTHSITHRGNPWTIKVDKILALIGAQVYETIPFQLGVLGEEASSRSVQEQLADLADDSGFLVPTSLFEQQKVIPHGLSSPGGLWWTGGKKGGKGEQWYRDNRDE